MRKILELLEIILRSYRMSDQDIKAMSMKGYYFDADKSRFIK
jgi:hypothetical protein